MKLYGMPHWGSDIVEYQLALYGLDYAFVKTGNLFDDLSAEDALRAVNPLRQIPTLMLEDGAVMTESAAITLLLADMTERDDLVPGPGAKERAAFLRWLIFIVANIYPTYTYVDMPSRFVADERAQDAYAQAVHDYAKTLYGVLEGTAKGPWFLGQRFSALDIYVAVITRWTPRRDWHADNSPKLMAISEAVEALPGLKALAARA